MPAASDILVVEFRSLLDEHADALKHEQWPEADAIEGEIRLLADRHWMEMATCYVEHHGNGNETG